MASYKDNFNVKSPPRFDCLNFPIWKIKMKVFLKSLGRDVSLSIEKEFKESDYVINPWPENIFKAFEASAKATYALMWALNDDDLSRVINCESVFEIYTREPLKLRERRLTYSHQYMRVSKCMRMHLEMICLLVLVKLLIVSFFRWTNLQWSQDAEDHSITFQIIRS